MATSGGVPTLVTETRFMQQYRVASATHGGSDIVAIRNASGGVEVFTVGNDGTVWNFHPDPDSDTGYDSVKTGLVASTIAVGADSSGRLVVLAANIAAIDYVVAAGPAGPARWGPVQQANMPPVPSGSTIAQIYAENLGGALMVGVLTRTTSAAPVSYSFSYSDWNQSPGVFADTSLILSSLQCLWSGPAADASFVCLDETCLAYRVADGSVTHGQGATFQSQSVDSALDAAGTRQFFAVLADGNLYRLQGSLASFTWSPVASGTRLREMAAVADGAGAIHLFALGADSRTYHAAPLSDGGWGTPIPIWTRSEALAMTGNSGGNIELFLIGAGQGALTRLIRAGDTGDWQSSALDVETLGQVHEFVSYASDIAVEDSNGAPMPYAAVEVTASAQAEIHVNGAVYVVDPDTPAVLSANAAGMLSIVQPTDSLGIPSINVALPHAVPGGTSIAVRQYAGVQQRLSSLSANDLLQARDAQGALLLGPAYHDPATASALAQAFAQCMDLANSTAATIDPDTVPERARRLGVGRAAPGTIAQLNRIVPPPGMVHWQLDFSSGKPVYRELSAEAARALIADKTARLANPDGFFSFFGDLGDVLVGVGRNIVRVVDTVVTQVQEAVTAAITFVIDEVEYVYNAVVSAVEHAFDLCQAFLAKVEVSFKRAFEWLGFVFDWADILRSHSAIVYTVQQYLEFLPQAAAGLKGKVDAGIQQAEDRVAAAFQGLIDGLGGSLGGYIASNRPDNATAASATSALANNVVLNGFVNNYAAARPATPLPAAAGGRSSSVDPVLASLAAFGTEVSGSPNFGAASAYMQTLASGPEAIFTGLLTQLVELVRDVVEGVLADIQAIAGTLADALGAMITALDEALSRQWDVPFVSQFYKWLTKADLTVLDLLALSAAIPATILTKLIRDAAPFPTDASLEAYKASFSAATILAASGLRPNAPNTAADAEPLILIELPPEVTVLLATAGFVATVAGGIFSAMLDGPAEDEPTAATWPLALGGVAAGWIGQATAIPGGTAPWTWDCSDRDGANNYIWVCETLGVAMDTWYTLNEFHYAEQGTDKDIAAAFGYGCCHILTVAAVSDPLTPADIASKIASFIPEVAVVVRFEAFKTPVGTGVLAALDGLGAFASGLISLIDTASSLPGAELRLPAGAVPRG